MGRLTARGCSTLGPGKHIDGDGLWLYVSPTGARKWVLRVTVEGKRREMGLGAFGTGPDGVSLAAARKRAAEARAQAGRGVDPIEARKIVEEGVPSFVQAAARYIRAHRHGWSNAKHGRQWCATLKAYARPVIGSKPVDQITTEDVLRCLSPIWTTRTETAKRLQGRVEAILDFAAARKWREPLNPARWRGHLDKLLPRPSRVRAPVHRPAMPYQEVPLFLAEIQLLPSVSSLALQFLILTATRSGEVLGARWAEVDLEAGVWSIPAARMKAKRPHNVPLTKAALALLESVPQVEGCPYVFPGAREGKPLSGMALLQCMRGKGYGVGGDRGDYVPHGFRSSFRDWAGEVSSFPRDVCEMALAHAVENKVEAAYRRGDLFDKRRAMMEQWAGWCTRKPATVTRLKSRTLPAE